MSRRSSSFACVGTDGEIDLEVRALAEFALDPDDAAVLRDDPLADGQSQARPLAFGGEEGGKELGQMLGGDPRPVIGEVNGQEAPPLLGLAAHQMEVGRHPG